MNGIEKISARILADAEAEAAAIRGQAEEKAAQIAADYDKKIAAEQQRLSAEVEAEAPSSSSATRARPAWPARRQLLRDEAGACRQGHSVRPSSSCRSLPPCRVEALCAHLACGASTSGCEELIFSAEDRERVGAAVTAKANELLQKAGKPAQLTLSAETRPIRGGVVLKNGLIETNCSLGTLVDGLRPELSGKVAARLFG